MQTKKLQTFFSFYLKGFLQYDLQAVRNCYQWPCTLNTPDKCVYVANSSELEDELSDIFAQLKQAGTKSIQALKASYSALDDNLLLVCVDWQFIDSNNQVFTDFSAIYHLLVTEQQLKIVNVISHELSNSITLTNPFSIAPTQVELL